MARCPPCPGRKACADRLTPGAAFGPCARAVRGTRSTDVGGPLGSRAPATAPATGPSSKAAGRCLYGKHAVVVLVALVLLTSAGQAAAARACEESGYCSVGISQHFVGDIRQGAQLRAMLEAVTFKKELVLTIFQPVDQDLWIDQVLQLHHELMQMGYAHHIFVTANDHACKQLNIHGKLSCVWDSTDLPDTVLGGETALWHQRWKLMGRATRLGYNVMSIDTDFIWFRDPYVHFKSPPFKDIQMLGVPEGGSIYNCNGGFMYVQNARPDGPATWVFKQVAMSTVRRADDGYKYVSTWTKGQHNCLSFDQAIIYDALVAAAVGRPLFPNAFRDCKQTGTFTTRTGHGLTFEQVKNNIEVLTAHHLRRQEQMVRPDPQWLAKLRVKFVSDFDSVLAGSNITVPNLSYGYPEELGGRLAPVELGNLSTGFIEQLENDCPGCPWWPEHRPLPPGGDPLEQLLGPKFDTPSVERHNMNAFYQPEAPQERFAQIPNWLASSLSNTRRGWVLGKNAPVQGPLVLGHVHVWHMQTARAHKAMIRKVYGRYNWTLGEQMAHAGGHPNAYGLQKGVTRVLALSPDIDLSRTRNWAELSSIIAGLVQVAYLSHRVLLLPELPCQTAWLHDPDTLKDKDAKLCMAPTFWRTPYRYPVPVTVAVDERGELVGGWVRRLAARFTSPGGVPMQSAVIPPVILRPDVSDQSDLADQSDQSDQSDPSEDAGGQVPQGSSVASGGSSAGRSASVVATRRGLRGDGGGVSDDWWERQRYVVVMPQLWDPSCTKGQGNERNAAPAGFHAIIGPEFHHWLKFSDEGKAAKLHATKANTVFTPASGLWLRPPLAPGGDSAAVPAGSVVPTSNDPGWSWFDVQAALPVVQVLEHVRQFADEPLLYLGHPVMVVHSPTNATSSATQGRTLMMHERRKGKVPHPDVKPDDALTAVNDHIRQGKCKALWTEPETHDGKVVDLGHGQCSVLVNGVVQPLQQAT